MIFSVDGRVLLADIPSFLFKLVSRDISHVIPRNDNKGDSMYLLLLQKKLIIAGWKKWFSVKGLGGRFNMFLNHFATSGD